MDELGNDQSGNTGSTAVAEVVGTEGVEATPETPVVRSACGAWGCPVADMADSKQERESGGFSAWGRDLLVAVLVSMFIILFLYQPVRVEGTSMLPVLEDQDRLFINKFAYSKLGGMVGQDIHRGDVVVFLYPHDTTQSYIKRVLALPGDTIRIDHGQVIVNNVPVKEPYVPGKYADDRSFPEMTLPADKYFVLGDHRSVASDSRYFGPVSRNLIYGRAAFVYWPMDQAGVVR